MTKKLEPVAASFFRTMVICAGGFSVLLSGCGKKVETEPTPEVFAILSAVALDREFAKHEGTADRTFRDKLVIVTGTVKKVTKDQKSGRIAVELFGLHEKGMVPEQSVVDCLFHEPPSGEASLVVGSRITVRGRCEGRMGTWVTLESCSLESSQPADKPDEKTSSRP